MKKLLLVLLVTLLSGSGILFATGQQEKAMPGEETEKVSISFWTSMSSTNGDILAGLVDDFNAFSPNVKVDLQYAGNKTQLVQKLMASIAAKALPDVADLGTRHGVPQLFDSGALLSIDELMKLYGGLDLSEYVPAFINQMTYRGKLAMLPFANSTPVIHYNKNLFSAAGLDPEKAPVTWDELIDYGQRLNQGQDSYALNSHGNIQWYFYALIMENDGVIFGKTGEPIFDSQAGVGALQFWSDLVHKYKIMPALMHKEATADFTAGKVAMVFRSVAGRGAYEKGIGDKFEYGMAFFPKHRKQAVPVGGDGLGFFKTTDSRQRAAWEFILWLNGPEPHARWASGSGYLPVTKSSADTAYMQDLMSRNPRIEVGIEQLQYAQTEKIHPADGEIWSGLGKAMEAAESDAGADLQKLLNAVVKETESYINNYTPTIEYTPSN